MEELSNKKRVREDESESDSPEVKRIRDDLLGFLDDLDPDPTIKDLDSVMKSFEEEISPSSSSSVVVVDLISDSCESPPDLGFLLEASDDELGLPPSINFSGEEAKNETTELVRVDSGDSTVIGSGLWGFDEQFPNYESFEVGIADSYNAEYVSFDDGLFEYSDACFDYSDNSWRLGTMPAE